MKTQHALSHVFEIAFKSKWFFENEMLLDKIFFYSIDDENWKLSNNYLNRIIYLDW